MPMYWTFNCFLGCIYTVYYIVHIVFLVLNWLSNLEFWLPKKEDQVARIGVRGGGVGNSGNPRKKTFLFHWRLPLVTTAITGGGVIFSGWCPFCMENAKRCLWRKTQIVQSSLVPTHLVFHLPSPFTGHTREICSLANVQQAVRLCHRRPFCLFAPSYLLFASVCKQ